MIGSGNRQNPDQRQRLTPQPPCTFSSTLHRSFSSSSTSLSSLFLDSFQFVYSTPVSLSTSLPPSNSLNGLDPRPPPPLVKFPPPHWIHHAPPSQESSRPHRGSIWVPSGPSKPIWVPSWSVSHCHPHFPRPTPSQPRRVRGEWIILAAVE